MVILAQHGYGKSDYVETGITNGHIDGVILSPRDESPDSLKDFGSTLRSDFGEKISILFDPQFYATTIPSPNDRYLPDYSYYASPLTRGSFNPAAVQKFAANVLRYQESLGFVDRIISPSVYFRDFNDPWSQISLSLIQAAIEAHKKMKDKAPPLLLSLVLDVKALGNNASLDELLNVISVLEAKGFYFIVKPETDEYPAYFDQDSVANMLRLVYTLAELHRYEVICGYSDFMGTLSHAVGATASGSGWYSNLRQFTFKRFQQSTGGKRPRARYTSQQLVNSIPLNPELISIAEKGALSSVLSRTRYDNVLDPDPAAGVTSWNQRRIQCLHHWEVLDRLCDSVCAAGSIQGRLQKVESIVSKGLETYTRLEDDNGIAFSPPSGSRNLVAWKNGIQQFRTEVGI